MNDDDLIRIMDDGDGVEENEVYALGPKGVDLVMDCIDFSVGWGFNYDKIFSTNPDICIPARKTFVHFLDENKMLEEVPGDTAQDRQDVAELLFVLAAAGLHLSASESGFDSISDMIEAARIDR